MLKQKIQRIINAHPILFGFLVGAVIRGLAEIIIGKFPIGYDASTYYIYMCVCNDWEYMIKAPLYSFFVLFLYRLLGNALIAVKIGATLVSGLFTMALTMWALNDKNIKRTVLFSFVFFVYTYWLSLRITWDLHRNLLSISLALMALSKKDKNFKLSLLFAFLSGFAHTFSIIFLSGILITDILLKRDRKSLLLAISNFLGTLIIIVNAYFTINYHIEAVFDSNTWVVTKNLLIIYFLWVYFPIFIIIIVMLIYTRISKFKDFLKETKDLLIWVLIIIISALILKFGYRILFLAFFPLLLFTFRYANKNFGKKALRLLILFNIVISIIYPLYFYINPIHPSFRKTHPAVLLGGNMFPGKDEKAEYLLKKAWSFVLLINSTVLIIHHSEIAYAYAAGIPLCDQRVYIMIPDYNFSYALNVVSEDFEGAIIVWYVDPPIGSERAPQDGKILYLNETLAVFFYNLSLYSGA